MGDLLTEGPLVSVIIPSYNRAGTIGRAMDSVLAQSYRNLELIVVDDGSSDGTVEIVNGYNDRRVKLIEMAVNSGPSVARNTGAEAASGEYLAFQDSDDEWLHGKLAKQMKLLVDDSELGFVSSSIVRWVPSLKSVSIIPSDVLPGGEQPEKRLERLLKKNYAWTQTWVMRRGVFRSLSGFDPGVSRIEDWDFVIRVTQSHKVLHMPEPLVMVYDTPGSLLSDRRLVIDGYHFLLHKYRQLLAEYPRVRASYHRAIAYHQFAGGETAKGRKQALAALRADSGALRNWLFCALSLCGARLFNIVRLARESRLLRKRL